MAILELPCGIQVGPGRIEKTIEVRKMSAKAQRDGRSEAVKANPALMVDALIVSNVLKVGQATAMSNLKNDMLMADREWLVRQLRKITFGPVMNANYTCMTCVALKKPFNECQMTHKFDVDAIPTKGIAEEDTLWWDGEKTFKIDATTDDETRKKAKMRVFEVANDKLAFEAVFRYPNGVDERKMGPLTVQKQEALAIHELLCRCLMKYNDKLKPRGGEFDLAFIDDLDLPVVIGLEKAFLEKLPGPEKIQEIECQSGHRNEVQLTSVDFLEPETSPT